MQKNGPWVSVVLCTRDRARDLERALTGLAAQTVDCFEVVLVDQSRTEETCEVARGFEGRLPHLRYFNQPEAGLSRAYNRAVREARGSVLAFTDDDCFVPKSWLRDIADALREAPQVDVVYGQVLAPKEFDGTAIAALIPCRAFDKRVEVADLRGFNGLSMGANFAARRAAVEKIAGFDEVLGGGGPLQSTQDFDFAYRTLRAGGTILLDPKVIAYHYGVRPHDEWPRLMGSYGIGVGGFYAKHIRLGDIRAAQLLATATSVAFGQAVKATLLRRSDARAKRGYAMSILRGACKSFEFPIDRAARLYVARPATEAA